MPTLRFKLLLLAFSLVLLGGAGMARAGGQGTSQPDTSHKYCPHGSMMYQGIFGYWCEDSTINGAHPMDCKSGPGQLEGTWNNSSLTPDQLCMAQGSMAVQPTTNQ